MSSNSRDMYVHVFYTLMQENLTPCTKKIVKPGVCFNNGFISCRVRVRGAIETDGILPSPPRFSSPFLRLRRQMLRMGHCRRSKPPSFSPSPLSLSVRRRFLPQPFSSFTSPLIRVVVAGQGFTCCARCCHFPLMKQLTSLMITFVELESCKCCGCF